MPPGTRSDPRSAGGNCTWPQMFANFRMIISKTGLASSAFATYITAYSGQAVLLLLGVGHGVLVFITHFLRKIGAPHTQ